MIKRLILSLALAVGLIAPSHSAGTIAFSLSQQFDSLGKPLANCYFYTIQAGTTSTPQNSYQDSALTQALPNPMRCDASGRLPQFFLADGLIKVRITDKNGVSQAYPNGASGIDNIEVIGPSGGGGGGGTVDPTTIMATGDLKVSYGTGILSGFVRANGRTIGSSTSGATERANSDCQSLFVALWNADANLAVSGGRGASGAADWAANKTIALPDLRGRALAGLDDMGNTAAGRLTAAYFGTSTTTLGAAGGAQTATLATGNLPPYTPSGSLTIANGAITINNGVNQLQSNGVVQVGGGGSFFGYNLTNITATQAPSSGFLNGNPQGGSSAPFSTASPMMLATIYLKL